MTSFMHMQIGAARKQANSNNINVIHWSIFFEMPSLSTSYYLLTFLQFNSILNNVCDDGEKERKMRLHFINPPVIRRLS